MYNSPKNLIKLQFIPYLSCFCRYFYCLFIPFMNILVLLSLHIILLVIGITPIKKPYAVPCTELFLI